jgi:DNA-binding MarR family transcriptional regulator
VSTPGLRVLVLLDARPSMNLTAVAEHLGVNASTASRSCDRLVVEGLVDRRDDPDDRRNIVLTLTKEGRRFVRAVMAERKRVLVRVLEAMPPETRDDFVRGLSAFSAAAAELGVVDPER